MVFKCCEGGAAPRCVQRPQENLPSVRAGKSRLLPGRGPAAPRLLCRPLRGPDSAPEQREVRGLGSGGRSEDEDVHAVRTAVNVSRSVCGVELETPPPWWLRSRLSERLWPSMHRRPPTYPSPGAVRSRCCYELGVSRWNFSFFSAFPPAARRPQRTETPPSFRSSRF